MEELRSFNTRNFYAKLAMSDEDFNQWLINLNLLYKDKKCIWKEY